MSLCRWWTMAERAAHAETDRCVGWVVLREVCQSCGWKQIAVAPVGVPLTGLECSRCHALSCTAKVVPK